MARAASVKARSSWLLPFAAAALALGLGAAGVRARDRAGERLLEDAFQLLSTARELDLVGDLAQRGTEGRTRAAALLESAAHRARHQTAEAALTEAARCARAPACEPAFAEQLAEVKALHATLLDERMRAAEQERGRASLLLAGAAAMALVCAALSARQRRRAGETDVVAATQAGAHRETRDDAAGDAAGDAALAELLRARLEELYALRLRAWESDRFAAYGEIGAGLSHGLKTPLASIRAAAQVAQARLDPDHPAARHLEDVVDEVDGLIDEVRRFLQATGTGSPVPARISPRDLVEAIDRAYRDAARDRALRWDVEVSQDVEDVLVDPALVEMALRNLIENALDAAPAGSAVRVAVERGAAPRRAGLEQRPPREDIAWIDLSIADQGPGMPPEVVEGGRVASHKREGSGLGFAIARRIVARHGGAVDVDASAAGTVVHVRLPVAGAEAA